nr:sarcosine oxidase subunit gamma [Pontibaca salina]
MKPITPLWGTVAQVDNIGGMRISECPDWALASVASRRGKEDAAAAAAAKFLGFDLPDVARCATKEPFAAFWMGPHQWMIEAPHDTHEDLAAQVTAAVGENASVTEQTDGWVRFDLEGPHCHSVLELLCNANTRAMDQGAALRTQLAHLGCFLICRKTGTHFSVIGPRSSAGSLRNALITAVKSAT